MKSQLMNLGIAESKIRFTHNSVDLQRIEAVTVGDRDERSYDACFLGRLSPLKGIFDIVEIYKELVKTYPNTKIALMGADHPKYREQLRDKIKDSNLENNIFILGAVNEDEKYAVLKSSKIFIFPSYEEGWGIAILEAMACGLAIVAHDLPAYEAFSEPIIKIPVGDKQAFLDKIRQILEDETLWLDLSKKSKETARNFNWDRITHSDIEKVFSELKGYN